MLNADKWLFVDEDTNYLQTCQNEFKSKVPVSQLVNAEVNSGSHNRVPASNCAIRICGRHTGMKTSVT